MASHKHRKKERIPWRVPMKGMLLSLLTSVILILLLTLFVYLGWLEESAISIGNTVIKVLAAAAAGVAVGRHRTKAAWWYGGVAAVLSTVLLIALMSVYLGAFTPSWSMLADLLMSFAVGGAIAALLLKKRV